MTWRRYTQTAYCLYHAKRRCTYRGTWQSVQSTKSSEVRQLVLHPAPTTTSSTMINPMQGHSERWLPIKRSGYLDKVANDKTSTIAKCFGRRNAHRTRCRRKHGPHEMSWRKKSDGVHGDGVHGQIQPHTVPLQSTALCTSLHNPRSLDLPSLRAHRVVQNPILAQPLPLELLVQSEVPGEILELPELASSLTKLQTPTLIQWTKEKKKHIALEKQTANQCHHP